MIKVKGREIFDIIGRRPKEILASEDYKALSSEDQATVKRFLDQIENGVKVDAEKVRIKK